MRDIFNKFSIPDSQQESLIASARAGQRWDVYNPAATPVRVETNKLIGKMSYTIKRYADGSVAASGVELPPAPGAITTMRLSGCRWAVGSGYRAASGCQIDATWGTVLIGAANMSYTLIQGRYDTINGTGYGFQKCAYPTSCASPTLVMSKTAENAAGRAYARWQSDISAPWASWTNWVQLTVGGDSAESFNS